MRYVKHPYSLKSTSPISTGLTAQLVQQINPQQIEPMEFGLLEFVHRVATWAQGSAGPKLVLRPLTNTMLNNS